MKICYCYKQTTFISNTGASAAAAAVAEGRIAVKFCL
jgi:hypothetical protein